MFEELSPEERVKLWNAVGEFITDDRNTIYDDILEYRTRHFTIALEDIYQEHNAGALARTAECYGIQDVHIMKNHNEFKIARGMAKGARSWLDFHKYDGENNIAECLSACREKGYQIVATTPHKKAFPLQEFDITKKSAFFFGTEKNGLHQTILEQADEFIYVPIYGVTESYNVSISSAIILHELCNKLHKSDLDWKLSEDEQVTKKLEWAYETLKKSNVLYRTMLKDINPLISLRPK
ncbi:MAG: TrmH family RNA methyltransferase [Salibacteraceae bacterium]